MISVALPNNNDLRSTYATRLSAGGVADEWVTQFLRQGDARVFRKYSQMKLQMRREALQKLHRTGERVPEGFGSRGVTNEGFATVLGSFARTAKIANEHAVGNRSKIGCSESGRSAAW
jgi:hypothetical protein